MNNFLYRELWSLVGLLLSFSVILVDSISAFVAVSALAVAVVVGVCRWYSQRLNAEMARRENIAMFYIKLRQLKE